MIVITIVCSANVSGEILLKFLLPMMGVAKFAGKIVKEGSIEGFWSSWGVGR